MIGHKAGDNGQILALAEALGWPFEIKNLRYRKTEILTNLFAGPTLAGLDRENSDELGPPWPELVISAGRRNEPLVRWIQSQAGGWPNVRLVHVGRPWALHECFDLIVTTPQYRLPTKPNILHNEMPLHRVNDAMLKRARAEWAHILSDLPAPRIAVIAGGHAGPYCFDRENGSLLGHYANKIAKSHGGSIMVTNSARTPAKTTEALFQEIHVASHKHRFGGGSAGNPYLGYLAWADQIIVTCDSMSMLAEACETGKPVHIFDLLRGTRSKRPPIPSDDGFRERTAAETIAEFSLRPFFYKLGIVAGPKRLTRDVSIIHQKQVEARRANWLGEEQVRTPLRLYYRSDDLQRASNAVKALFTDPPPARPSQSRSLVPEWIRRFGQG